MQDLKRQSNRRPAVRKLRLPPSSIRKNRSNPMPGLPVKLSKPNAEPSYINSWIPPYFVEDDPAFLQMKIRWLIQKFIGFCGLVCILWLSGGSIWVGKSFFQQPLKKVLIKGNQILDDVDVVISCGPNLMNKDIVLIHKDLVCILFHMWVRLLPTQCPLW